MSAQTPEPLAEPGHCDRAAMTIPAAAVSGLVLAGGLGRRISTDGQGTDKGLVRFRGRALAAHAIERLRPQVGELIVNANRHAEEYRALGCRVVPDALPGFVGPLAGLLAGMSTVRASWVVSVPCDSPFLPEDLVARLVRGATRAGAPVAVASCGGREQPVFLLAATTLRDDLARYLAQGGRRIDAWYRPLHAAVVAFPDETAFHNINTLADLQALE